MCVRAHVSQTYCRLPFSTEQVQVAGGVSLFTDALHRAQATTAASCPSDRSFRGCVSSSTS